MTNTSRDTSRANNLCKWYQRKAKANYRKYPNTGFDGVTVGQMYDHLKKYYPDKAKDFVPESHLELLIPLLNTAINSFQ